MKIAIIGAGIAGLAAAYDLTQAGHNVVLFEAADKPGGLATGFHDPHWKWPLEHFYHHWFETDDDIINLINEIGGNHKLFFPKPTTSFFIDDQLYPFDSPLRVMLFPKLSLISKVRFGLVALYLRLTKNWQGLEKKSADAWLSSMLGEEAYETLWKPLLIGKFGSHYQQVNMAWFWARIHKRSFRLGYYEGGFQGFIDDLTQSVQARQADLRLNARINTIKQQPNGQLTVLAEGHEPENFDRVLATVSPQLLNRLVPELPEQYLTKLKSLKSMGAVVLILALKQKLTEQHYWINIPDDAGVPFLALVEHTNFIDSRYYGNEHIVYCGDYLPADHEYFDLSKEELLAQFLPNLSRFNPNFRPDWVRASWLFRAKYAQPIPPVNHGANIPAIKTPIPGLYWASMSQVYPWDRGTNYAVEIGRRAARMLLR